MNSSDEDENPGLARNTMTVAQLHQTLCSGAEGKEAQKLAEGAARSATKELLLAADAHGRTAAHFAARFGQDECLRSITDVLEADALRARDAYGRSPCDYAAKAGHVGCLKAVVEYGKAGLASVRPKTAKETAAHLAPANWSAVHWAAYGGHVDALDYIVSKLGVGALKVTARHDGQDMTARELALSWSTEEKGYSDGHKAAARWIKQKEAAGRK